MIKPEQVPDEVMHALSLRLDYVATKQEWRAAIAAAINAWPGMYTRADEPDATDTAIILPMPPESSYE